VKPIVPALLLLAACRSSDGVTPPAVTKPGPSAEAPVPNALALPTVRPLLDDPRLVGARAFERVKDWPNAAKAVHDARLTVQLSPAEACAWDFLEGRLFTLANLSAEALAAFEHAEAPMCTLAGHATLRSAQALARAGRADDAIAKARTVPADLPLGDDVKIVIAESLAAKNNRAAALPMWRSWLAANPHGPRWVDTSIRIANADLDGIDGPAEEHAREAYDAATRVIIEAPKLADSSGATAARSRAVAFLHVKDPSITEPLDEVEKARQAQAYLDANDAQRAFDLAGAIPRTSPAYCKAALTRANAGAKKAPKTDVWSDAVDACGKDTELVTALYAGAKARSGKDPARAIEWFGKVEELFPQHRLADDARFRAAMIVAQSSETGHEDRAEQMLRSLPDAYPAGDMKTEALFRVALVHMSKGDYPGAKSALDRIVEIAPEDRHYAVAGRAEYFRARVDDIAGNTAAALPRYRTVIEKYPLSYYMLLSYDRLAQRDPAGARRLLDEAAARDREPPIPAERSFPSHALVPVQTPAFGRGIRLLEVSDLDMAKREFAPSLGDNADPEVVWTVGALYNQAGFFETGFGVARGKASEQVAHYPEGKWRLEWETSYPRAYEGLVDPATAKYGLPRPIAWGIMREESTFIADVKSPANAYGLMQLIVPTAKGVAVGTGFGSDEASLKRPEVSIELGTKLLAGLRQQQGHVALAIGAYNAGGGAVGRWMSTRTSDELDLFVENVPYEETRNYVKRVLSSVAAYAYLYDRKTFDDTLALPLRLSR